MNTTIHIDVERREATRASLLLIELNIEFLLRSCYQLEVG